MFEALLEHNYFPQTWAEPNLTSFSLMFYAAEKTSRRTFYQILVRNIEVSKTTAEIFLEIPATAGKVDLFTR